MHSNYILMAALPLLLAGCGYEADVEALKARVVAEQIERFSQTSLASVRPYITGERSLADMQGEPLLNGQFGSVVSTMQATSRNLVAQLDALQLDGTRPLGACRDALVSSTTLLADAHARAQAGQSLVGLLPQLDQADLHTRNCAETSARLGLPLTGQP